MSMALGFVPAGIPETIACGGVVLVLRDHVALKGDGRKGPIRPKVASVDDDPGLLREFALHDIVGDRGCRGGAHWDEAERTCSGRGAWRPCRTAVACLCRV